ncbi:MAG: hypothetical protein ACE5GW_05530 [Planctomycetota bacterium]
MSPPDVRLQVFGAVVILLAYLLLQMNVLAARSRVFLLLNLGGAAVLAWEAWRTDQAGFLLLEGTWALVSGVSLLRAVRAPSQEKPAD